MVGLLLNKQDEEERDVKKESKPMIYSLSELHRIKCRKVEESEMDEKPVMDEELKGEEWDFEIESKEYPMQEQIRPIKNIQSTNEMSKKSLNSDTRKIQSFTSLPKYTFWNRQPKVEEIKKKETEDVPKEKPQPEHVTKPKKYKMITDEIDGFGGKKIKVTKLVEDI